MNRSRMTNLLQELLFIVHYLAPSISMISHCPVNIYWSYTVIIETMIVLGIYNYQYFSKSETIFGYIMYNCWIKKNQEIESQPGLFL